jgi:predicted alpha/beta hydrolase
MNTSIASVQLNTQDNTVLRAMQYACKRPQAQIVIAGATGVPQGFYKRYAMAANEAGFNVLTLDYRGVGQSKLHSLKGFKMDYLDWGKQDLTAAIEHAQNYKLPIFVIGHSYGGHALGLLENSHLIEGAYVFGTGAGWSGWMPPVERLKVNLMWKVIAPLFVRAYGYLAWSKLGMGEDLPKDVYRQWKHWCQFPHYFFDDPKMTHIHSQFARFNKPIVAANASDDKWAQPRSRDAFFKGYSNAIVTPMNINPPEVGMKQIDHMGYFKKEAGLIWEDTFDWINKMIPAQP